MVRCVTRLTLVLILPFITHETRVSQTDEEEIEYTNLWVVRVADPEKVEKIANENGYKIKKMVSRIHLMYTS